MRQDRLHHGLAGALPSTEGVDHRPHHGADTALERRIDVALQGSVDLGQRNLEFLARQRQQHRVLVAEVLVERADADAGALGHRVGGEGGQAAAFQNLSRRLDDRRHGLRRTRLTGNSSIVFNGLWTGGHGDSGWAKASKRI